MYRRSGAALELRGVGASFGRQPAHLPRRPSRAARPGATQWRVPAGGAAGQELHLRLGAAAQGAGPQRPRGSLEPWGAARVGVPAMPGWLRDRASSEAEGFSPGGEGEMALRRACSDADRWRLSFCTLVVFGALILMQKGKWGPLEVMLLF